MFLYSKFISHITGKPKQAFTKFLSICIARRRAFVHFHGITDRPNSVKLCTKPADILRNVIGLLMFRNFHILMMAAVCMTFCLHVTGKRTDRILCNFKQSWLIFTDFDCYKHVKINYVTGSVRRPDNTGTRGVVL